MRDERSIIRDFATKLAMLPAGDPLRVHLAQALYEHVDDLWPQGEPGATPEWLELHLDEVLAVVERLYGEALCLPTAHEFLDRLAWLPGLLESPVGDGVIDG